MSAGVFTLYPADPMGLTVASLSNTVADMKDDDDGGRFVGGNAYNPHASDIAVFEVFDAQATDVTLGTTTPVFTVTIPPGETVIFDPPRPIRCSTGLSYVAVDAVNGTVAPTSAISVWIAFR